MQISSLGLCPKKVQDLDSAEVERNFLAAIGFDNPNHDSSPLTTTRSNPASHEQEKPVDINTPTSNPSRNGVQSQNMSGNGAQNLRGREQTDEPGQVASSSQWKKTTNQPLPLTTNYWESQRLVKGISKPSAYHGTSAPPVWDEAASWFEQRDEQHGERETRRPINRNDKWDDGGPSAEFWGVTSPKPFTRESTPRQRMGPVANLASSAEPKAAMAAHVRELSPDLIAFRVPRPNKNYTGSATPSLPSSVSAVDISDAGVRVRDSNEEKSSADIRNTIGLRPNIHQSGNTWQTYNWADPTGAGRDDNEALWAPSYLSAFVTAWMNEIPNNIHIPFRSGPADPAHWRCDIDTSTGSFMPPVSYPHTMVDHAQVDPELDWRRQNWTSNLLIRRHIANPRRNQRGGNNMRRLPGVDRRNGEYIREVLDEDLIVKVHETPMKRPQYNHFVPRIPCFLRPAQMFDMDAVRLIYNWEVQHGLQALDCHPLSTEDFEKLLATAQAQDTPFIVAVRGSARELGLTKGTLIYSVFQQMPFREANRRGEVLGFALLSPWQSGLAVGSASGTGGNSTPTARIHVYVRPDSRRHKIGFSLLDMLLTSVSDRFSSQSGYDFVDPDGGPAYKSSSGAERRYFHLYLSYLVRHQHRVTDGDCTEGQRLEQEQKAYGDDLKWVKTLLEERFNFTEVVRFEAVRLRREGAGAGCWLDEVMFEHTCLFDPRDARVKEG